MKQDLKISEGILATLYEQQWEPSSVPFELTVEGPTPRGRGLTVQNFYVPKFSVTLAFSLFLML